MQSQGNEHPREIGTARISQLLLLFHCVTAGGASSIISSLAVSIAGYRRKTSVRGGAASCAGVAQTYTTATAAPAAVQAGGNSYVGLHSTALTAVAVAEKKNQRQTVGGLNAAEGSASSTSGTSLSGGSDTSSNFGPEYLPGALGVAFIPITLVFKDLR